MATHGAEDFRGPLRRSRRLSLPQPGLTIHALSAVVHAPSARALPACAPHKKPQALSPIPGLSPLRVAHDLRPQCLSGIPPNCVLASSPGPAVAPRPLCTRSASAGARRCSPRSARYASVAPSGVSKGPASFQSSASSSSSSSSSSLLLSSQCHGPCPLEAQRSLCQLDPLRFGSGLLGKRASSPQLSVYPTCPSPPKASTSHRGVVVVETAEKASMPTNQSSPWSSAKLKDAASVVNGLTTQRPSSAAVPSSRARALSNDPPKKLPCCSPPNRCRGGDKGDGRTEAKGATPLATVPSEEKSGGVLLSRVQNGAEGPRAAHMPLRAQKVNSEFKLTAAVRKLVRTSSAHSSRALNGYAAGSAGAMATSRVTSPRKTLAKVELPLRSLTQREGEPACVAVQHPGGPCAPSSPCASSAHHCAIPGETSPGPPLPAPSVYSVTSDLSAIHLTRKGGAQGFPDESVPIGQDAAENQSELEPKGQETVAMLQDGEEEELPDELENDCSGDDNDGSDCCSMNTDGALDTPEEALSVEEPMSTEVEDERVERPALVTSLFPLLPPTLYFSKANEKVELLPLEQRKLLKWRMSSVTPNVVKHTIARSHFKVTKKSHDWLGCWGHHMKSPGFKAIREYQKLNHFPGSFQIGRKDRLWRNLSKMQTRFGKREFNFFPRSFVLPLDIKLLRKAWEDGGGRQKWIIKPPASARGIGIQVIHKWSQMPRKRPLLVQKYIHKPYLISGNKFDLRIYVYVTSYDPLRVYIFNDGLVRFASCKYSSSMKSLGNKFMHLTNYSVNKKNSEYQSNSDDKACQGHKWALKALWQYLGAKGVNTTLIWEKIKDIVIKTIIASEPYVNTLVNMHVRSPYSCHELFGFDIMLDEKLKPWVLEVNISPSLHSNTALDVAIKGQMIRDVLNLAGFVLPQKDELLTPASSSSSSSLSSLCGGGRERCKPELSTDEKVKRAFYMSQRFADQDFLSSVLDVLTPGDVRVLAGSEDELTRQGEFQRIFPSPTSARYLRFFENPRYLNILLSQWEQKIWQNRSKGIGLLWNLCQKGVHLGNLSDTVHHWSSKSYTGHVRTDFNSNPTTKTELTRSSVLVTLSVPSLVGGDEEALDREVQSVTSSLPDISVLGSASASPTPSLSPTPSPSPSLPSDCPPSADYM
ncbi:tubulin polyglutamylase TTLL4 [Clupea harengus]|uniref:Tubulin polyglutamylase TTLL4 n=1 Tax=Clupea harengus TaxID=7950 RepID=A0A6P8GQC7_CLUHA|nr:tubulin polyglutamylase TTLL4 [Clupea harengus]XP_031437622.1 tubulin polyglutamylase TTLL4 [Clupea harengus]